MSVKLVVLKQVLRTESGPLPPVFKSPVQLPHLPFGRGGRLNAEGPRRLGIDGDALSRSLDSRCRLWGQ